jgi:hypothetical protein
MEKRPVPAPLAEAIQPGIGLKATIVNCTPDHNKGASAISWGLVNRLTRTGLVDDIALISTTRSLTTIDYRHTRERFRDVPLFPSPLPSRNPGRGEYSLRNTWAILRSTIGIHWRSYRRALARRENAVERILASDIVLNRGGPFFSVPTGSLHVGVGLSWPLILARRAGVPYALVGEEIRPFAN